MAVVVVVLAVAVAVVAMVGVSQTEVTFCVAPTTDDDEDYTRQAKQAMPASQLYVHRRRAMAGGVV